MKKWYNEEYEFTVEVTGFLRKRNLLHGTILNIKSKINFRQQTLKLQR